MLVIKIKKGYLGGKMCDVSVIIPVYNAKKYLKYTLESIINQTLKNIQIIIINDGSKDNSLSICEMYSKIDSRIIIINKKNEGVSIARNHGIEIAKGEYLMFIDADDWIEPNMCELLYNNIKDNDADMTLCNHIIEHKNEQKYIKLGLENILTDKNEISNNLILPLVGDKGKNIKNELASFRSPWGKIFKKSIIKENNIKFNSELIIGEDFIFNLQYLNHIKKLSVEHECLYHYRINQESTLNKYKAECWFIYEKILNYLKEYLYSNFKEDEFLERLNNLKMRYFFISIYNEVNILNSKSIFEKKNFIKFICEHDKFKGILKEYKFELEKREYINLIILKRKMYISFVILNNFYNILVNRKIKKYEN